MQGDLRELNNVLVGILLGVLSNFTDSTLPCSIQNFFSKNDLTTKLAKHSILILIIFTSLTYKFESINEYTVPIVNFVIALCFWAAYRLLVQSLGGLSKDYKNLSYGLGGTTLGLLFIIYYLNDVNRVKTERAEENGTSLDNDTQVKNINISIITFASLLCTVIISSVILFVVKDDRFKSAQSIPEKLSILFVGLLDCDGY